MDFSVLGPWQTCLEPHFSPSAFAALMERVDRAYTETAVFPPRADLFSAFSLTPPDQVRVVILGQDPYHGPGQAHGLAFSVAPGVKPPPSLVNIYREREADLGLQVSYIEDVHYFVNYPSPNWWWGYPGYWDPFYWGYGGYWGYSFPVYYSYDTNSLLTEIIDLTASDKSEDAEVPVLWNSFITGVSTGYAAFDIRRTVTGINQSFEQSPYFKAAQQ